MVYSTQTLNKEERRTLISSAISSVNRSAYLAEEGKKPSDDAYSLATASITAARDYGFTDLEAKAAQASGRLLNSVPAQDRPVELREVQEKATTTV